MDYLLAVCCLILAAAAFALAVRAFLDNGGRNKPWWR